MDPNREGASPAQTVGEPPRGGAGHPALALLGGESRARGVQPPGGRWGSMVARRGFEPLISALKGRRPGPLDERAADAQVTSRPAVRASASESLAVPGPAKILVQGGQPARQEQRADSDQQHSRGDLDSP